MMTKIERELYISIDKLLLKVDALEKRVKAIEDK